MAERSLKTRHAWRAGIGGTVAVIVGYTLAKNGASPSDVMLRGWQFGSFAWGLASGYDADFEEDAATPAVVGGAAGGEYVLPPDGPLAYTGPAAGGWVLGAVAKYGSGKRSK